MQTLILTFVIPAIAMIFAAVFAALWWRDRTRLHVAAYAYCYVSLGAAVIINIFIFQSITPLGIVAYHLLSMSGLIALLWGTAHRVGLKTPLVTYVASAVFTAAILWAAISVGATEAMRVAQHTNSSLLMALTAQNLWHAGSKDLRDRAVIWVIGGFAVFGFVRPLLSSFSDQLFGAGAEGAALLLSIHVLVMAVFFTLLAVTLLATILGDKEEVDRELAALDHLSGLPTRAKFQEQALAMHERARANGVPLSMVIADLDHFKRVNDTHGHAAGDQVIAAFGKLISSELRPNDICGRIGGEEFCIIAHNCEAENARSLANRLLAMTNRLMIPWNTQELVVTASFGVAQWEPHEAYEHVFQRADGALYCAKNAGRNRAYVDSDDEKAQAQDRRSSEVVLPEVEDKPKAA